MTNQTSSIQQVFERRILIVNEISQLNAEHLRITQKLSGNQFDIMRCRETVNDTASCKQAIEELKEAEARDHLLKSQITECDDKLQTLEAELTMLDRQLLEL